MSSSNPLKKRKADHDRDMTSPSSASGRARPKVVASRPQAKRSQHELNCLSLQQQCLEQLNRHMAEKAKVALTELQALENNNSDGPPIGYESLVYLYLHFCDALFDSRYNRPTGRVMAFGSEEYPVALGISQHVKATPVFVKKLPKLVDFITAAAFHNVAIKKDGSVYTWGGNEFGTLGRQAPDETQEGTPAQVTGFVPSKTIIATTTNNNSITTHGDPNEDFAMIGAAAGDNHTVFLSISGNVYMCGTYVNDGNLFRDPRPPDDDRTESDRVSLQGRKPFKGIVGCHFNPIHVKCGAATAVACGANFSAALLQDGCTICTWGIGNSVEMARPAVDHALPREPYKPEKPSEMSATQEKWDKFHLEVQEFPQKMQEFEKELKKLQELSLTPHPVQWADAKLANKKTVLDLACGAWHILVTANVANSDQVHLYTSGLNGHGQLGHGDRTSRDCLTRVEALVDHQIAKVAAGMQHSICLSLDGSAVYAFGRADGGQCGHVQEMPEAEASELLPVRVPFPQLVGETHRFSRICSGDNHNFAVSYDKKRVYSWGMGDPSGALGHGTEDRHETRPREILNVMRNYPSQPQDIKISMVAAGGHHSTILVSKE